MTNPLKRRMFSRLLLRSLSVKRPQAILAIGALVVGAAVTSTLLNIYADAHRKMTQELQAYGPNVMLTPAPARSARAASGAGNLPGLGGVLDQEAFNRVERFQSQVPGMTAAPLLYVVVLLRRFPGDPRLPDFQDVVAVGTNFSALRKLFPTWRIQGTNRALGSDACAIGANVATKLHLRLGDAVELKPLSQGLMGHGQSGQQFRVAAILSTGGSEDDQVILPLASLQDLAGYRGKISLIQASLPGGANEIQRRLGDLTQGLPGVQARPIQQIVHSAGKVLGTIRSLMLSLTTLILVIIALCVGATMAAIVLDRRRDIAVMKALGASDQTVVRLFLSEGAVLGFLGGLIGFASGGVLAGHLGRSLFGVSLNVVWWTFPVVCLATILLAVLATAIPVRIVRGIQPAVVLKGE